MIIVDRHNKVLPAWAEYRRSLSSAPRLITLDHHTDTSRPFRSFLRKQHGNSLTLQQIQQESQHMLSQMNFNSPEQILKAVEKIDNDEHIVAAIQTDIISDALIIAHNAKDTDLQTYREHRILCKAVDDLQGGGQVTRADCDRVLESDFLSTRFQSFSQSLLELNRPLLDDVPYILDLDLDYFNTRKSISPQDSTFFRRLSKRAGLITIATEPSYVAHCALDPELDSQLILKELMSLIDP